MTGAIIVTWGTGVRGRETKSVEVFGHALAYLEGLAKQGRIHGHREYIGLTGNVGRWAGTMIIDGEVDELQKLQLDEEFHSLLVKGASITEDFTVQLAVGGSDQSVQAEVTKYIENLQSLGIA